MHPPAASMSVSPSAVFLLKFRARSVSLSRLVVVIVTRRRRGSRLLLVGRCGRAAAATTIGANGGAQLGDTCHQCTVPNAHMTDCRAKSKQLLLEHPEIESDVGWAEQAATVACAARDIGTVHGRSVGAAAVLYGAPRQRSRLVCLPQINHAVVRCIGRRFDDPGPARSLSSSLKIPSVSLTTGLPWGDTMCLEHGCELLFHVYTILGKWTSVYSCHERPRLCSHRRVRE